MGFLRRLASALLGAALLCGLLGGCVQPPAESVPENAYYHESLLTQGLAGAPQFYTAENDQSLGLTTRETGWYIEDYVYHHYTSANGGESWQEQPPIWQELNGEERFVNGLCPVEGGGLVASVLQRGEKSEDSPIYHSFQSFLYYCPPGGAWERVEYNWPTGGVASFTLLGALPGGLVAVELEVATYSDSGSFLGGANHRYLLNGKSGEIVLGFDASASARYLQQTLVFSAGEHIYQLNTQGQYDPVGAQGNAKQLEALNATGWAGRHNTAVFAGANNVFYCFAQNGLSATNPAAQQPGENAVVLPSHGYSFSSPMAQLGAACQLPGGDFLLQINKADGTGGLYRYSLAERPPSEGSLRVFALQDSRLIQLALAEYSIAHPNVQVEYEYLAEMGGSLAYQNLEAGLLNLNVQMAAGLGPDVLFLEAFRMETFAQRGFLANITGLVQQAGLLPPLEAYALGSNGEAYFVPASFSFPVLFGPGESLAGLASLADVYAAAASGPGPQANMFREELSNTILLPPLPEEQRPLLHFESFSDLFSALFPLSAPFCFNAAGLPQQEPLGQFLELMRGFSDIYGFSQPNPPSYFAGAVKIGRGTADDTDTYYTFPSGAAALHYFRAGLGWAHLSSHRLPNYLVYLTGPYGKENPIKNSWQAMLFPALMPGGIFSPGTVGGISAESQNPAAAQSFLQVMLSPSVQNYDMYSGLPVTVEGFYRQEARLQEMFWPNPADAPPPLFREGFAPALAQLNTPYVENLYTQSVVEAAALGYCTGKLSLQQALAEIDSKLTLYLQENVR